MLNILGHGILDANKMMGKKMAGNDCWAYGYIVKHFIIWEFIGRKIVKLIGPKIWSILPFRMVIQ